MTTINSISASLYISQATITITRSSGDDKPEEAKPEVVAESEDAHGHRHRGGSSLMRSVVHALRDLGLTVPGDDVAAKSNREDEGKSADLGKLLTTFVQDLRQVLTQSRVGREADSKSGASSVANSDSGGTVSQSPDNTTAGAVVAGETSQAMTLTSVSDTTDEVSGHGNVGDVVKALHAFLHELRRALAQTEDPVSGGRNDKDQRYGLRSVGWHGDRNYSANLDNLVAALSDPNQASLEQFKPLQEDYDRLLSLLDGGKDSAKPSLVEFLNKLKVQNPAAGGSGSIVSTTA